MTGPGTAIVWFRRDLRLDDNPALQAALARGLEIVPAFIWSPEEEAPWEPGAATRWWLHHSLEALSADLLARGGSLVLRRGPAIQALMSLVRETGAQAVFWNRVHDPALVERDARIKSDLRAQAVEAHSYNSALLFEPGVVQTRLASPYTVFTPFWRACMEQPEPARPEPAPARIKSPGNLPGSNPLGSLELLPGKDWAGGLRAAWTPGEAGAARLLDAFLAGAVARYGEDRDVPSLPQTSRLSPHLHFGEVSPRRIWHAVRDASREATPEHRRNADHFLREVGWREFAHHLLFHFPATTEKPLRPQFADFPWKHDEKVIRAWQKGRTGYPIVDAGMRELWTTGWMHNRVRMVVASMLVKHLLTHWSHGARWFWDTLVDADLANNTLGWQWTAGCGADAAPYFRIFNPILQGEKFDAEGAYVRKWCPELSELPNAWIHKPFEAPSAVLAKAGVVLGRNYPEPIVDQKYGRDRALAAYDFIKRSDTATGG